MKIKKTGVGVIGCGAISAAYLKNLTASLSGYVQVIACADLQLEIAQKRAAEFGIPHACSVGELLKNPAIEIVLNLTIPAAHYPVSCAILDAGKHVFTEKPLALTIAEGQDLLVRARQKGLQISGAADTLLGASMQTALRIVAEGKIGVPAFGIAMVTLRPASPNYYKPGLGPLFDMGPYYLSALLGFLGPVRRVSGTAQSVSRELSFPELNLTVPIETPVNCATVLEFTSGAVATFVASCEAHGYMPRTEIFGSSGRLVLTDANHYGGEPQLATGWDALTPQSSTGFREEGRGLGVAELALALQEGTAPRYGNDFLLHVLEIMAGTLHSSQTGKHVTLTSTFVAARPFSLPPT